jgi:hypothetical protein
MAGANNLPAVAESVPPATLDSVKTQATKVVGEIHALYDCARELDDRNELPFDLCLVEELRDSAEEVSNAADGIE